MNLYFGFFQSRWRILGPSWDHFVPSWGHRTTYWGHLGPSWGDLGPFLGDLGPSLRAQLAVLGLFGPQCGSPKLPKTFCFFFDNLWVHVWTTFWTTSGPLLDPFWGSISGPNRPKRRQVVPKAAINSFKVPKTCILQKP